MLKAFSNPSSGFLVVEYLPQRPPSGSDKLSGSHTPLRQDGIYSDLESAKSIANAFEKEPVAAGSRIAIVQIKHWNKTEE